MFRASDVEQSENKRFRYNQIIIKDVTRLNYSFQIKNTIRFIFLLMQKNFKYFFLKNSALIFIFF